MLVLFEQLYLLKLREREREREREYIIFLSKYNNTFNNF